jgi:hypothetical protein
MRVIIQKNRLHKSLDTGVANGYLVISDKKHICYGKHYDDIDVEVHGGLTYSARIDAGLVTHFDELTDDDIGSWMIGFDTCHYGDTAEQWTVKRVRQHAKDRMLSPRLK